MGENRTDIEAGFEETGQTIPGAEQAPAGDSVDTNALKDDLVGEIACHGTGGNAEQGHAAAVLDGSKRMVQGSGVSGHFKGCIDAFSLCDFENGGGELRCLVFDIHEYSI